MSASLRLVPSGADFSTTSPSSVALRLSAPARRRDDPSVTSPAGAALTSAPIRCAICDSVRSWRISSASGTSMRISGSGRSSIVARVTPAAKRRSRNSSPNCKSCAGDTGPDMTTLLTLSRQARRTICGASASCGRLVTLATAVSTSFRARDMSQPGSNSRMTVMPPSRE